MMTTEKIMICVAVLAGAVLTLIVKGANITVGETRYVPVDWSPPRISIQNGRLTVIPPAPRFRREQFGTYLEYPSGKSGVIMHYRNQWGRADKNSWENTGVRFRITRPDGNVVKAALGDVFEYNNDDYLIYHYRNNWLYIRNLDKGKILKLYNSKPR